MDNLQKFLNKYIAPVANWMNNNLFFSSLAEAFMRITPITLGGAFVLLIGNFPIPAWTDFLNKIGWAAHFTAAQNATMNVLAMFVVFLFAYVYAKKCDYDPLPSGLLAISSFLILAPQDYMAKLAGTSDKLAPTTAFSTNYLGASGMVVAILVGWLVGALYVWLNKKNIVVKLPASVPPNVAESLRPSFISGIILIVMAIIRGLFAYTTYGNVFALITTIVQTPLQHFTASPISLIVIYTIANVLWFFGIHPNMVYGVITPILTANGIMNMDAFKAGKAMPFLTMAIITICLGNGFGGQGTTIGLVISMARAKSRRYKDLFKLAAVPALFNINEPLIFGMPIMLNPTFFIPMLITPIVIGLVSWGLIPLLNVAASYNPLIQLPWTAPGVVQGFLEGGISFGVITIVVVILSVLIWYPFFKIADNQAYAAEHAQDKKAEEEAAK